MKGAKNRSETEAEATEMKWVKRSDKNYWGVSLWVGLFATTPRSPGSYRESCGVSATIPHASQQQKPKNSNIKPSTKTKK